MPPTSSPVATRPHPRCAHARTDGTVHEQTALGPDEGHAEWVKYWATDKSGHWYRCWWLGSTKFTFQLGKRLPRGWGPFLRGVRRKGSKKRTRRTLVGGCRVWDSSVKVRDHVVLADPFSSRHCPVTEVLGLPSAMINPESTRVPVLHQSADAGCFPLSLANVLGSSKKKRKKLMWEFGSTRGGMRDLARAALTVYKLSLSRVPADMTLDTLVAPESRGLYVVRDGVHCVGVDCERRLIFDSTDKFARPLSRASFAQCNIHVLAEARAVM